MYQSFDLPFKLLDFCFGKGDGSASDKTFSCLSEVVGVSDSRLKSFSLSSTFGSGGTGDEDFGSLSAIAHQLWNLRYDFSFRKKGGTVPFTKENILRSWQEYDNELWKDNCPQTTTPDLP